MGASNGSQFTRAGGFWLLDTETANMIGYFKTESDALRAVAEIVRAYGAESPEARNLALGKDGQEDPGLSGAALIRGALKAVRPQQAPV